MPEFKTIKQVWNALDKGKEIFWIHDGYKVFIEPFHEGNYEYTKRGNKVLAVRFIENYFGSLLEESELPKLFTVKKRK